MVRKVTTMFLIGGSLMIAACNTVRGAGEDLGSAANATENAINNSVDCDRRRKTPSASAGGVFCGYPASDKKKAPPAEADEADFVAVDSGDQLFR